MTGNVSWVLARRASTTVATASRCEWIHGGINYLYGANRYMVTTLVNMTRRLENTQTLSSSLRYVKAVRGVLITAA